LQQLTQLGPGTADADGAAAPSRLQLQAGQRLDHGQIRTLAGQPADLHLAAAVAIAAEDHDHGLGPLPGLHDDLPVASVPSGDRRGGWNSPDRMQSERGTRVPALLVPARPG